MLEIGASGYPVQTSTTNTRNHSPAQHNVVARPSHSIKSQIFRVLFYKPAARSPMIRKLIRLVMCRPAPHSSKDARLTAQAIKDAGFSGSSAPVFHGLRLTIPADSLPVIDVLDTDLFTKGNTFPPLWMIE
jgi:hypothetical protein